MRGSASGAGAVVGFAVLAAFVAWHWFALVSEPAAWRWGLCTGIAVVAGLVLAALGRIARRPVAWLAAAAVLVGAVAAGSLAVGLPARLLAPGGWPELADGVTGGLAGISQVALPYDGPRPWTRLGILLAAPLALTAAAALAFWPRAASGSGASASLRRGLALVLLVCLYGVAVSWEAPSAELARGLGLLVAIALFLWLPWLPVSRLALAGAVVALAGGAALPAAARVDTSEPLVDYTSWKIFGAEQSVTFGWDHSYGPLDWPQRGAELFRVRGVDRPLYWKTWVLDEFDGVAWRRGSGAADGPPGVPAALDEPRLEPDPRWLEEFGVSILALRSPLLVTAGQTRAVSDVDVGAIAADGTTTLSGEGLAEGDSYGVDAYVPDPSPRRLKRSDDGRYPRALERYTTLQLPPRFGPPAGESADFSQAPPPAIAPLDDARRPGSGHRVSPSTREAIAGTPYARVADLAERVTRGADGNYEAVVALERHLVSNYDYEQIVPRRRYPLPAFLFRDRAGYCQQFSGAMALMLRMVGIPSRVVSGFAPGRPDPDDEDAYVVHDTDAHSWVEVWFPRVGWITVDPTPPAAPARTEQSLPGATAAAGLVSGLGAALAIEEPEQRGPHAAPASRSAEDSSPPAAVPLALGLAATVGVGLAFTYWRRRRLLLSPRGAGPQLREVERALRAAGLKLPPGATLRRIEAEMEDCEPRAAAYLATIRDNRYRHGDPERSRVGDRRALRRALARGGGVRRRLRVVLAVPPGGPRAG